MNTINGNGCFVTAQTTRRKIGTRRKEPGTARRSHLSPVKPNAKKIAKKTEGALTLRLQVQKDLMRRGNVSLRRS